LQTLPDERDADDAPAVGKVAGFSLHAGVAAKACQRDKLERLCRYVTRPAIAEQLAPGVGDPGQAGQGQPKFGSGSG